jgi:hypothetical protein
MTTITLTNGQVVSASSDTVNVGSGVTATLNGLGNTVDLSGDGSNLTVNDDSPTSSQGNYIVVSETQGGTLGDVITLNSGTTAESMGTLLIEGNGIYGATITLNDNQFREDASNINIEPGSNVVINGTDIFGTLVLNGNDSVVLNGEKIDPTVGGANSTIVINSNAGVSYGNADSVEYSGYNTTFDVEYNSYLALNVEGNTTAVLNMYGNSGAQIGAGYSGNTINFLGTGIVFSAAYGLDTTPDTITDTSGGNTINYFSNLDFSGSNDNISIGGNLIANGNGNTIFLSNNSGYATITGNNTAFSASFNNEDIVFKSSADSLAMNYQNQTTSLQGSGNTVALNLSNLTFYINTS